MSPDRPCTPLDTVFSVASISKVVVAILSMQCVERGELSLDADVNTVLPPTLRVTNPHCEQIDRAPFFLFFWLKSIVIVPQAHVTARCLLQHRFQK